MVSPPTVTSVRRVRILRLIVPIRVDVCLARSLVMWHVSVLLSVSIVRVTTHLTLVQTVVVGNILPVMMLPSPLVGLMMMPMLLLVLLRRILPLPRQLVLLRRLWAEVLVNLNA